MSDQPENPKRKRGRPPVNENGRKNVHLAFRVRDGIREKLQASADASSCSLSEEVERRLEHSLDMALDPIKLPLIRMIVEQWRLIDLFADSLTVEQIMTAYAKAAVGAVETIAQISSDLDLKKFNTSEAVGDFFKAARASTVLAVDTHPTPINDDARESYVGHVIGKDAISGLPLVKSERAAEVEASAKPKRGRPRRAPAEA